MCTLVRKYNLSVEAKTQKSEMTQAAIVDAALEIAIQQGMSAISMQAIAGKLQISKSGVFKRSGSLASLQRAVINEYNRRFLAEVLLPAMQKPRGIARLNAIIKNWQLRIIRYKGMGASIYEAIAFGANGVDADLHESMAAEVNNWRAAIKRVIQQAIDEGHLRKDTDSDLLLFELQNLLLGTLYQSNYIRDRRTSEHSDLAYTRIIQAYALIDRPASSSTEILSPAQA